MHSQLIESLYFLALPYYVKAEKVSPVAHIEEVMLFANEIVRGEKLDPISAKIYLVACLLHDIGLCNCKMRKIVESEVDQSDNPEQLKKLSIMSRLEHMLEGKILTERLLRKYAEENPFEFFEDDIKEIVRLVSEHDYCKLVKLDNNPKWLNKKEDWLLQLLNEADALWMLTERGIEKDMQRGSGFSKEDQMKWNINQHKKVYWFYEQHNKVDGYGFKNETMYRSNTGYKIFRRLTNDS